MDIPFLLLCLLLYVGARFLWLAQCANVYMLSACFRDWNNTYDLVMVLPVIPAMFASIDSGFVFRSSVQW